MTCASFPEAPDVERRVSHALQGGVNSKVCGAVERPATAAQYMAMNLSRIYMLACDHRWQWEEWCDASGVSRSRIQDAKRLVFRAFEEARERSVEVRRYGALLLDSIYGAPAVAAAHAAGVPVGTPVERAGRFPLEWQDEPFYAGLTGNSFAKVLVRHRPEWEVVVQEQQFQKLLELQAWCRGEGMPLLVEIIIMRNTEEEREFEEHGRPSLLASLIRDAYRRNLVPDLWKIEGTSSTSGAALIDAAIRERPGPRQLILGKGADGVMIARWFDAAAGLPSTAGFAIGRSVFWGPCTSFLLGQAEAPAVIERMADTYLGLIAEWNERAAAVRD
jgi:5-dehydro-2-deoxygluconokinase